MTTTTTTRTPATITWRRPNSTEPASVRQHLHLVSGDGRFWIERETINGRLQGWRLTDTTKHRHSLNHDELLSTLRGAKQTAENWSAAQ